MSLSKLAARTFESGVGKNVEETNSNSELPFGLNKWQLALLIGAPVILGGIAYYYYSSDDSVDSIDSAKSKPVGPSTIKVRPAKSSSNSKSTPKKANLNLPAEILAKNNGNEFFKHHKYKEASECYSEAIKLCPPGKKEDLATFYQNRAASNEMLGLDAEQIISDCTEAIKLNPKYTKALIRRAKSYEKVEQYENALTDITAAIILESFANQASLQATDRILRKHSRAKAREFSKSRVLTLPSNQFIQHYFGSFTRDPLFAGDMKVDADKLISKLSELTANATPSVDEDSRVNLLRGTLEILKGDVESAQRYLNSVITNIPSTISTADQEKIDIKVNALIKLGTVATSILDDKSPEEESSSDSTSSKIEKSLQHFSDAVSLDPSNADIFMHRAQLLLLSDKIEDSRKDLEKAVSLAPSFESAIAQKLYVEYRFAVKYGQYENMKSILEQFEETTKKFPNSSEILSLYAQSQMELDNHDIADKYFLKALQADPLDANLYVHRAILLLRQNTDPSQALKLLQKGTQVDPKCQFAHEMLGTVHVQMGNLEEGIKSFKSALGCAQSEADLAHIFALKDAAEAQLRASAMLGISLVPPSSPF